MEKTKCRNISGLDEVGEEEAGWFQNGGPSPWARGTGKGNKSDNCCTCLDRNTVCLPSGFCGLFREGPDHSVFSIRSVCPARRAVLFPGGCLDLNVSTRLARSGNQLVQTSGLKPTQTSVFSALWLARLLKCWYVQSRAFSLKHIFFIIIISLSASTLGIFGNCILKNNRQMIDPYVLIFL